MSIAGCEQWHANKYYLRLVPVVWNICRHAWNIHEEWFDHAGTFDHGGTRTLDPTEVLWLLASFRKLSAQESEYCSK